MVTYGADIHEPAGCTAEPDDRARCRPVHRGDPRPWPSAPAGPCRRRGRAGLDPCLACPAGLVWPVRRGVLRAGQAHPVRERGDGLRRRGPGTARRPGDRLDLPRRGGGRRPDRLPHRRRLPHTADRWQPACPRGGRRPAAADRHGPRRWRAAGQRSGAARPRQRADRRGGRGGRRVGGGGAGRQLGAVHPARLAVGRQRGHDADVLVRRLGGRRPAHHALREPVPAVAARGGHRPRGHHRAVPRPGGGHDQAPGAAWTGGGRRAAPDGPVAGWRSRATGPVGPAAAAVAAVVLTLGATNAYISGAAAIAGQLADGGPGSRRSAPKLRLLAAIAAAGLLLITGYGLRIVGTAALVAGPTAPFLPGDPGAAAPPARRL